MRRLAMAFVWVGAAVLARDAPGATTDRTSDTNVTYTFQLSAANTLFTALRPNGSSDGYDIAILGDGFTASAEDQANLTRAAVALVEGMFTVPPYSDTGSCINVWLVNLVSNEQGIDDPTQVPPYQADTALDCSFAAAGSMAITASVYKAFEVCTLADVPHDAIYVIVRDQFGHDGAWAEYEKEIAYSSDKFLWGTVMAHEMGHLIGRLADEYRAPSECAASSEFNSYVSLWSPEEPNITDIEDSTYVPWAHLIQTSTLPTTFEAVCDGKTIGLWEGGDHLCYGLYRPREYCLMDGVTCDDPTADDFCAVCMEAIRKALFVYGCPSP